MFASLSEFPFKRAGKCNSWQEEKFKAQNKLEGFECKPKEFKSAKSDALYQPIKDREKNNAQISGGYSTDSLKKFDILKKQLDF